MKQPIFIVIFDDNTRFIGGTTYFNTKWREIPKKKIKILLYKMPNGQYLSLKNFDKYYHMIEALTDLNGKNSGKVQLQYAYIIGKKGGQYSEFKIPFLVGETMKKTIYKETDKNITRLNPLGWKG